MTQLNSYILTRNKLLPKELHVVREELETIFKKNILSAGIMQPGYFDDFRNILSKYKSMGIIDNFMLSEEEYTDSGNFYKIPVIDIKRPNEHSNIRILLSPM